MVCFWFQVIKSEYIWLPVTESEYPKLEGTHTDHWIQLLDPHTVPTLEDLTIAQVLAFIFSLRRRMGWKGYLLAITKLCIILKELKVCRKSNQCTYMLHLPTIIIHHLLAVMTDTNPNPVHSLCFNLHFLVSFHSSRIRACSLHPFVVWCTGFLNQANQYMQFCPRETPFLLTHTMI